MTTDKEQQKEAADPPSQRDGVSSDAPPAETSSSDSASEPKVAAAPRRRSDLPFFLVMGGLSSCFLLLIVLLLAADVLFTSPSEFVKALSKPEIQYAAALTFVTCTVAAIMSVWVATPLGYILSRYRFPGRALIDTLVDIPIVLPPLVLGLSLLIMFHLEFGRPSESARDIPAEPPPGIEVEDGQRIQAVQDESPPEAARDESNVSTEAGNGDAVAQSEDSQRGWQLERWLRDDVGFPVTYRWPAVILAQFSVACAFAVRTMRVTFDQMNPRTEDVARTLGCSRWQAFEKIALPQAWRGIIAAGTIAWARALGEFGPILVFAGATRMRTEVLSTSVFLELSIGNLDAAVAVSLLMVAMAVLVLCVLRLLGTGLNT